MKEVPLIIQETIPESLNFYLPIKVKEEIDPLLTDVKLVVNLNDKNIEKRTMVEETIQKLGTCVLEDLPFKVDELINEHLREET
jgi:hypothetical protein